MYIFIKINKNYGMNSLFNSFDDQIDHLIKKVKYKDLQLPNDIFNHIIIILFKNTDNDLELVRLFALIKMISKKIYNNIIDSVIKILKPKQLYYLTYQINIQKKYSNKWISQNSDIKEHYFKNRIINKMPKWNKNINKMVFVNCVFYEDTEELILSSIIFNKKNMKQNKNIICIGCVFCNPVVIEGSLCNIAFIGCIFTYSKIPSGDNILTYSNSVYENVTLLIADTIQYGFLNNQSDIQKKLNNIFSRITLENKKINEINNFHTNLTYCIVCKRKEKCFQKKMLIL